MKAIYVVSLVVTCFLAAGLVTTSTDDSRELRELSRRVDKLERSQNETGQALSRLAKSVADLEKRVEANQRAGDLRGGAGREQSDKRLIELEKSLKDLSNAVAELQKQVGPKGDVLTAIHKKIGERTLKLAEWFDQYHPKSGQGYYHQNEIKRIR